MSEDYYARIRYRVPCQRSNVEKLLDAIGSAVQDNWRIYRDKWSSSEPEYGIDKGRWLERCDPERLREAGAEEAPYRTTDEIGFSFSPLSSRVAGLYLREMPDGALEIEVSVSRSYSGERQGDRQRDRMERGWAEIRRNRGEDASSELGPELDDPEYDDWFKTYYGLEETPNVWPQNKACLAHIIAKLQTVLPVRDTRIHPQLQPIEPA